MSDIFSNLILTLHQIGFFRFLIPFILTSAIFYGLLRKSKIFGEPEKNVAVNATVAISSAFLVSAAPIIAGIDITAYLSGFLIYTMFVIFAIIILWFLPYIFFPTLRELQIIKDVNRKVILALFFLTLSIFIIVGLLIFNFFNTSIGFQANEEFYATVALLSFIFVFSLLIYLTMKPPQQQQTKQS
ncbi:MAG: hypothetical protein QW197_02475 [Candidatus Aenigmatarchaeota archaeon]